MRLLVALETHFARDAQDRIVSRYGTDGYAFWQRYLEVFDEVLVAARTSPATAGAVRSTARPNRTDAVTAPADASRQAVLVEGPRVEVVPLPDYRGPWAYLLRHRTLAHALRDAIARADALCLRAPGAIAGCAWRLRDGRPYAVEMVGDPYAALAPGAVRSVARPLARWALVHSARRLCHGAVAVAYVSERVLPHRYPTAGWSTSYSSLDLADEAFASPAELVGRARQRAAAARGTARDPWRLICVGSLAQPYKGQDLLIEAVARCRARGLAVALVVVGDGACRPALEAAARARGVGAAVQFTGHVTPGAALHALLDAADLFVLPSRTEGLPRAMIEAMARGVPAIGSRVGGIPELLPPERCVPPGEVSALTEALLRWCSPATDFLTLARRDQMIARRHAACVLRPRRLELYRRLRAAAATPHGARAGTAVTPTQELPHAVSSPQSHAAMPALPLGVEGCR